MSITRKDGEEWAQLVCTTDIDAPTLPICGEKFTMGRALGCNLSLPENKLISGQHCVLLRNEDGTVIVRDTSTNGTLISSSASKTRVTKGRSHKLQHGDEIFLVFKKEDPTKNVAYMFQDLSQLLDETLVNEDPESDEECTEEYEVKKTAADTRSGDTPTKRPASGVDPAEVGAVPTKRPRDNITDQGNQSDRLCQPPEPKSTDVPTTTSAAVPNAETAKQMDVASSGIGTATDTAATTAPGNGKAMGDSVAAVDTPVGATPGGGDAQVAAGEGIADNLICSICQDIFHDCISLQPCLHSFCAACYSSWMDISKDCPSCRNKVERISRNFIVNGLVDAFVKEHPDRKRSDDEKAEMDAKNKITRDMMVLSGKHQAGFDDDEDNEDSDDDYDEDEEDYNSDQNEYGYIPNRPNIMQGLFLPRPVAPVAACMQCPGYFGPGFDTGITMHPPIPPSSSAATNNAPCTAISATQPQTGAATTNQASHSTSTSSNTATTDQASTSTATSTGATAQPSTPAWAINCRGYKRTINGEYIPMPKVPQFQCQQGSNHLMCGCCHLQMPDRRHEYFNNPYGVPSQKCDVCGNFFCHRYWGCKKIDCNGCLNEFQDLHFGKKCLDNLILKNTYESEILKDYLKRKDLTWKDVLDSCMVKLDSGEYVCQDGAINRISSANVLCYHCGLKNFQELAYQYRRDIPKSDLPRQIASRPDCHWGSKCRTQANKLQHAKNFNHICEQTKF
ncbi:E3 ubiquitin-protein ligase CHFR-like [Patiria miniata]|uniref:E3 ubiquitin-protein ligase CHFR n=1 Tax=Patiria miniata TaxID=46514 RepID=A0A914A8C7_PATMI|nr:E3 ubiquitin-protein ligase CHFR-like [Patiria miniata]